MADGNSFWSGLGDVLKWIASPISSTINYFTQKSINKQNLDFARAQTQAEWERDDNAHQREVADLTAAGLSPLANTSGSQVSSPVTAQALAPQVDLNGMIEASLAKQQIELERDKMEEQSRQFDETHQLEKDRLERTLDIELKKVNEAIRNNKALEGIEGQRIQNLNDTLTLAQEQLKWEKDKDALDRFERGQEKALEVLDKLTGGHPYQLYHDKDQYQTAMSKWKQLEAEFLSSLEADSVSNSSGGGLTVAGTGFDLKDGTSEAKAQRVQAKIKSWYINHPIPVLQVNVDNTAKYFTARSDKLASYDN